MAAANMALMLSIRKMNKRNLEMFEIAGNPFKREQFALATILFFFELSFLVRFAWDAFFNEYLYNKK